MLITILSILFFVCASALDCGSAFTHKHDRLKDVEMTVSSWDGCSMAGTINGVSTTLFMDVASCPLHAKVPGRFRLRYDQTCGAVLEITDGPTITTPMPPSCPGPAPTPTPAPVPSPTPSGQVVLSGQTFFSMGGGLFPFTMVVLSDANGKEIQRMQEQQDARFSFTVAPGSYQLHVVQDGFNASPSRIFLSNVTASTPGISILNFTIGPAGAFQAGAPRCVPAGPCPPVPQPSPTPSPTPTPQPSPSPSLTPTPVPTPTPEPPRVFHKALSTDATTRTTQINNEEKVPGVKLIGCDLNICYFSRRP